MSRLATHSPFPIPILISRREVASITGANGAIGQAIVAGVADLDAEVARVRRREHSENASPVVSH